MAQLCSTCLTTTPTLNRGQCPRCAAQDERTRRPPAHHRYPLEYQRNRTAVLGGPCTLNLPGCTGTATTADHITPRSQGGTHALDNLQGACHHCNSAKGAQQSNGSR